VDAPLDDANIERFSAMIKRFSQDTQCIIITHNKKTMGKAEMMYGVTMPETGISRLVGVKLDEVAEVWQNSLVVRPSVHPCPLQLFTCSPSLPLCRPFELFFKRFHNLVDRSVGIKIGQDLYQHFVNKHVGTRGAGGNADIYRPAAIR